MPERKGAAKRSAIPADVLRGLNDGTLESATLAEGLAIDFAVLLNAAAPELPASLRDTVRAGDGITSRMRAAGTALAVHFGPKGYDRFTQHPSDTVRGWGAYLLSALPNLTLKQRLDGIRPLADDPHFGVREWAWLALREAIAADVPQAIQRLTSWTKLRSANLRRFASESTRPRGVWCAHIRLLKDQPQLGLPLLEPLRSDPAKYVRDSVANWLNDAGKSDPDWVRALCERWEQESPSPETRTLVARALRNL